MDLVSNPLDPAADCGIFLGGLESVSVSGGFTGAANTLAAAEPCYPLPTPSGAAAVEVSTSFQACALYPCEFWSPTEFESVPMCDPCDERWNVVTVAYLIRNEHQIPVHGLSPNCNLEGEPGCWTYSEWGAIVRYIRKPTCPDDAYNDIEGEYTFACAILDVPITTIYQMPSSPFGAPVEQNGIGKILQTIPPGSLPCSGSRCIYQFPYEDRCPTITRAKLCAPNRSGYGWTFPATITVTA